MESAPIQIDQNWLSQYYKPEKELCQWAYKVQIGIDKLSLIQTCKKIILGLDMIMILKYTFVLEK